MVKYLNETSKSFRYDKIQQAIEENIHKLAEKYIEENGNEVVTEDGVAKISDEKLTDIAYIHACEEFLDMVDKYFCNKELYWIVDIMLSDNFDNTPHPDNPYAVKKQKPDIMADLTPFGIMFNVK